MVAVKYFKTEGRTNELMYSINEGVDWKTVKFYKEPLKVRSQTTVWQCIWYLDNNIIFILDLWTADWARREHDGLHPLRLGPFTFRFEYYLIVCRTKFQYGCKCHPVQHIFLMQDMEHTTIVSKLWHFLISVLVSVIQIPYALISRFRFHSYVFYHTL